MNKLLETKLRKKIRILVEGILREEVPVDDKFKKEIYKHLIAIQTVTKHMDTELKVALNKKLNEIADILRL